MAERLMAGVTDAAELESAIEEERELERLELEGAWQRVARTCPRWVDVVNVLTCRRVSALFQEKSLGR